MRFSSSKLLLLAFFFFPISFTLFSQSQGCYIRNLNLDGCTLTKTVAHFRDCGCPGKGDRILDSCLFAVAGTEVTYGLVNPFGGGPISCTYDTYNWFVIGGTIVGAATDPTVTIIWDESNPAGIIYLNINEEIHFETCVQFLTPPSATISGEDVCLGQETQLMLSDLDADEWTWIIDGTTTNVLNPGYTFPTAGDHEVLLEIKKTHCFFQPRFIGKGDEGVNEEGFDCYNCELVDTLSIIVKVDSLPGPDIECVAVQCPGDTVCYSTHAVCDNYVWTVMGQESIIEGGGISDDYVCVVWSDTTGLGSITLEVSDCDMEFCIQPTEVHIPILSDSLNISGLDTVCRLSEHYYWIPKYPGATYKWEVSNGGTILSRNDQNYVHIQWAVGDEAPRKEQVFVTVDHLFLNPDGIPDGNCWATDTLDVCVLRLFDAGEPGKVCVGDSYNFRAFEFDVAVPADWTFPGGSPATASCMANVSASWSLPGMYEVMAIPCNPEDFCIDTIRFEIEVVEAPKPDSIAGTTLVCPGTTHQYTVHGINSPNSPIWTVTGGNYVTTSLNTIEVTWDDPFDPIVPYTVSVVHKLFDPECFSDSIELKVFPLMVDDLEIDGPDRLCYNTSGTYTLTPTTLVEPIWIIDPPSVGHIISGQGTYELEVQWYESEVVVNLIANLCDYSISFPVMLDSLPDVSILSRDVCPGDPPSLIASPSDGILYEWESETGSIGTGNPKSVSAPGCYAVTVTNSNQCTASAQTCFDEFEVQQIVISSPHIRTICTHVGDPPLSPKAIYAPVGANICRYEWHEEGVGVVDVTNTPIFYHNKTDLVGSWTYFCVVTTCDGCTVTSNKITFVHRACVSSGGGSYHCDPIPSSVSFTASPDDEYCNQITFTPSVIKDVSYHWFFGDGGTSSASTPTHTYTNFGSLPVLLEMNLPNLASNPDSCLVTAVGSVDIPLLPDFGATEVCAGDATHFTDASQSLFGYTIFEWNWDFGLGTATGETPSFVFTTGGHKTVTLEITATNGTDTCKAIIAKSVYVVPLPVADFDYTIPCELETVQFTDQSSGNPVIWDWDFGGGFTSEEEDPEFSFPTAGPQTVILNVTNIEGCSNTSSKVVNVFPAFECSLTPSGKIDTCTYDAPITITANHPTGAGYTYEWSTGETTGSIQVSNDGEYRVTITDANGCKCITESTTIQFHEPPDATITGDTDICPGESTTLCAPFGGHLTYVWDDVDASATVCIEVAIGGTYSVTVTDIFSGCFSENSIAVIGHPIPSKPIIDAPPAPLCAGTPISLSVAFPDPSLTYVWSNGQIGDSIIVLTAGQYYVTVINEYGCENTSDIIEVYPLPDICIVPSGCYEVCKNDTICFPNFHPELHASYEVFWNGQSLGSNTDACIIVGDPGIYQVLITSVDGCTALSDELELAVVDCECAQMIYTFEVENTWNRPICQLDLFDIQPPAASLDPALPIVFDPCIPPGGSSSTQSLLIDDYGDAEGVAITFQASDGAGLELTLPTDTLLRFERCPAQIGDLLWHDINQNGLQDGGELGIPNARVFLTGTDDLGNNITMQQNTDVVGNYLFENVPPGTYQVQFILPANYVASPSDVGFNEEIDSDVYRPGVQTQNIIIKPGACILNIDGGAYKCENCTSPGEIGSDEFLCGSGSDPAPIIETTAPECSTFDPELFEFFWLMSTDYDPRTMTGTWEMIPGEHEVSYDPGPIAQTSYYRRCVRMKDCNLVLESNIVVKTLYSAATIEILAPQQICVGSEVSFSLPNFGTGATYNWDFGRRARPRPRRTSGQTATVYFRRAGTFVISATVNVNGCEIDIPYEITVVPRGVDCP